MSGEFVSGLKIFLNHSSVGGPLKQDPAGATDHLNADGTRKRVVRKKPEAGVNDEWNNTQDHSSDLPIVSDTPPAQQTEKKFWWQEN